MKGAIMKTKRNIVVSLGLLLGIIVVAYSIYRFIRVSEDPAKSEILQQLSSPHWQERDSAVTKLLYNIDLLKDKKVKNSVVELFNKEVAENRRLTGDDPEKIDPRAEQGEGYGEYFIDLLDVIRRTGDKRALPGLIDSVEWGPAVEESIAAFGGVAVGLVIKKFGTTRNELKRRGYIGTLHLLYKQSISSESRQQIRKMLLEASKDESPYVRSIAQETLEKLPY